MTTPLSTIPLAQDIGWTTGTITGRIKAPDGSVSSPGFQFRDDPNTGIRRVGADTLAIVVAGFDAISVASTGATLGAGFFANGNAVIGWKTETVPRTSDLTLNATSNCSRTYTNTSAAGEVILTLPPSANGLKFMFAVDAAQYLRVKAAGTDTIRDAATVSAAAGYIRANVAGNVLEVECVASGKWFVTRKIGTWTVDS